MKFAIVYNKEIKNYDFGQGHPLRGNRFENFMKFFKPMIARRPNFEIVESKPASENELELVHSKEYINFIETSSRGIKLSNVLKFVSVDNLNPFTRALPEGIDKGARFIVGSALLAGELVHEGKFNSAITFGGLHHAKPNYGEGFCIYNDVAICAKNLLKKGIRRILILDTDAHAGNGTAEIFWEDDRVLLIDIHQDPTTIYPGTGFIEQVGSGKGEGYTVNIPLPREASDLAYEYVFDEVVIPLAEQFKPEIIIRNGGSDPHFADELTQLGLTLNGFRMIGRKIREIADNFCEGKEVDLIGSGYNQTVLPYAWLALIAGLTKLDISLEEPVAKPDWLKPDSKLDETKKVVKDLKEKLSEYWYF